MIIQINVSSDTPFAGACLTDSLDVYVEDNATEAEIEEACEEATKEWFFNYYNYGWEKA